MTVLYPNLCYKKFCFKGTTLYYTGPLFYWIVDQNIMASTQDFVYILYAQKAPENLMLTVRIWIQNVWNSIMFLIFFFFFFGGGGGGGGS